jgi:hypothetical protein
MGFIFLDLLSGEGRLAKQRPSDNQAINIHVMQNTVSTTN